MEFSKSERGKDKLVLDGYMFTKEKVGSDDKIIWKCEVRTCRKRVHTSGQVVLHQMNEHTHAPIHGKSVVAVARHEMKQHAEASEEPTRQVMQHALQQVPVEYAHLLPSNDSLRRGIRRQRNEAEPAANIMTYENTVEGQLFLRVNNENLVLFAADADLRILQASQDWACDGTFKVAPDQDDQLYTIHALEIAKFRPCVFAIMSGRSEAHYRDLLQQIKNLCQPFGDLHPETIMTDFELAAIKSMSHHFPQAELHGCLFHLGQSVWRHVQHEGLQALYIADHQFALRVRSLIALAFVPIGKECHMSNCSIFMEPSDDALFVQIALSKCSKNCKIKLTNMTHWSPCWNTLKTRI